MKRWRWVPGYLSDFSNGDMAAVTGNGYGYPIEYDYRFRDNTLSGAPVEISAPQESGVLFRLCLELPEGGFPS